MKKRKNNFNQKLMLIGIGLILLIGLIVIVSALTDDEQTQLQNELSQLESNLSSQGYGWLTNYNISYPYASVFRENSNEEIARFNIDNYSDNAFNKYQILLTNLGENESYDTFDLRSIGDVEGKGIPHDVLLMKARIDEIRGKLNKGLKNGGEIKDE